VDIPNLAENAESGKVNAEVMLTLDEIEKRHIINVMSVFNNSVRKAASVLGLSERTLQRKLKKIKEE
jgi:ActR/RegA family two-component response regulator